ncbi:MAG: sensor histidine kinase [Gaiellales bacterium]
MQRQILRPLSVGNRLEYAWFLFTVANLAAMVALFVTDGPHGLETVPFHFIYVSFTILYGFRAWRTSRVIGAVVWVTASTGLMTLAAIHYGREDPAELSEVPLMSLMFLAVVFHVRRRQQAIATAEVLASDLRESLDRQRAFVSDASHELLTPITIGRGHLELLRRQEHPEVSEVQEASEIVLGELARMDRLIDRLLLLESASEPGFVSPAPVDVGELVGELCRRWQSAVDREWSVGEVVQGTVEIDRDRMVLVMDALLENAVRHTAPGGSITISATAAPVGFLRLRVADNGDGIPEHALTRVFDRFYRVDRSRNRRVGGAGLGLSIVRAVVEAHGGRVWATSQVGHGATFTVELPRFRSAAEQPVAAAADGLDVNERLEFAP